MPELLVGVSLIFLAAVIAVVGIFVLWAYLRTRAPLKRGEKGKVPPSEIRVQQQRLDELRIQFSKRHSFQEGQLVRWKPGLRNKWRPLYDQPAVVVEILDPPLRGSTDETGSRYFREPLDIVLALVDEDGDFVAYHFDSRRFEPFPQK